ncbi:MAG: universal stress protein [Pseudohongiellaceae bacterium]
MFELSRILVVIEPHDGAQPAIEKAMQLAMSADAELELFVSDFSNYLEDGYYFDPPRAQELRREHGERHLQMLEKLAQPLRDNGLEVSCSTAWGNPPYEEVIKRAKELQPDLVIKATSHQLKIARLLLNNDDWELIRYCPVPLMLVKNQPWAKSPVFVAAVDPEHSHDKPATLDNKILATASELGKLCSGEVHLYHSTHLPPLSGLYPIHSDYQADSKIVRTLAEQHGLEQGNCHLSEGDITQTLPALCGEIGASAVIMGAVSRSRLDRMLIGNTAERVLDRLECDVIVIKPDSARPLQKLLL